jgi:arylsulfatase A
LPLVYQNRLKNETRVVEQPLDFTTLAEKYNDFTMDFLEKHKEDPFFLYMPFSHVHTTAASMPEMQYAGCDFKGSTERGSFGDALAESDWIVGNVMQKLKDLQLEEDTLVLFTSDNGPWLIRNLSGGSAGLFTGRFSNYWDTGKGSTWEGGIRMPAFAYWKGKISPFSRSSEIISSLDVFPTLSALAGLSLPPNRTFDGRDMSDILLTENGKSKHDFLFFYSTCAGGPYWNISSVRHGNYKAHWCTKPGFQHNRTDRIQRYDPPLLFNVAKDPSEAEPISFNRIPDDPEDADAMHRIIRAYAMEVATFEFGHIDPPADQPGEGPGKYGVCCDRKRDCNCRGESLGIFNLGTIEHHDRYHEILGEDEPLPHATAAQRLLQQEKESLR